MKTEHAQRKRREDEILESYHYEDTFPPCEWTKQGTQEEKCAHKDVDVLVFKRKSCFLLFCATITIERSCSEQSAIGFLFSSLLCT